MAISSSEEQVMLELFYKCTSEQQSILLSLAEEFTNLNTQIGSGLPPYALMFIFPYSDKAKLDDMTVRISQSLKKRGIQNTILEVYRSTVSMIIPHFDLSVQRAAVVIAREVKAHSVSIMNTATERILFRKIFSTDLNGIDLS